MWLQTAEFVLLGLAIIEALAGAFLFLLQTNWSKPLTVGLVCIMFVLFIMLWRPIFWLRLGVDLALFFLLLWGFQLRGRED